ncbi:TIGR03767 family metallophosphoesterase [Streptomyces sp. TRM43335]|uniref:TIGR03767 family metallophosphoesterase n=1 Tax=Streptomyces taklimakanensis TaxID=2569853 RepID=A0A6G2B9X7_9ACTN|nr:TIGR03767 family metallophosphoesterase [Streptomyces taklimakanensis]MTE19067.1 TIGR03767 family metallophosphoesterase [Streptomyces taklimakanensis]
MSRTSRSSRLARHVLDRRTLLAAGAVGVAGAAGVALGTGGTDAGAAAPTAPASVPPTRPAPSPSRPAVPSPAGTTVESVAAPRGTGGYRRLGEGRGWERVVREDLVAADRTREDRRTPLACFAHLTDTHVTDVQHPLRFEYQRAGRPGAWRPQEALTVHGLISLVERINSLAGGPATGAPLAFAMTTGDNTDNNCRAEAEWFLTAMSGGRITPDTGDPTRYEGVQDSGLPLYWHPEDPVRDLDKRHGFPRVEGLLDAARRQVVSPGLRIPWYSTVGNHDDLYGGHFASIAELTELAVGDRKLYELPAAEGLALHRTVRRGQDVRGEGLREMLRAHARGMRTVTPDPSRAPLTTRQYAELHLDPAHTGPGPVGHGYTRECVAEGRLYYSFRVADGVTGISLDTTDPEGDYRGHVSAAQLRWLDRELTRHGDDLIIVFSHHYSDSMTTGGTELLALLERHGNVVAWINGHSHRNRITPHDGFWEVTTASHVDHPQLARTVELTDNGDGTLSLFVTCVESAAPYAADEGDLSRTGLASLYRELAFNAPGRNTTLAGEPGDRNAELLLPRRR